MSRLRSLSRGGRLLVALAVGGAVFGIATAVQADIPDGGVIHGCYANKDGTLRAIDTSTGQACDSKKETPVSWNQTGPTGSTGPTGPSDAFATGLGSFTSQPVDTNDYTLLESFSLPAGNYVLNGDAVLASDGNVSPVSVECNVFVGANPISPDLIAEVPPDPSIEAIPITTVFGLSATTTVSVKCKALTTGARTGLSSMAATRVGSLTTS